MKNKSIPIHVFVYTLILTTACFSLTVKFINENPDFTDDNVYVMFRQDNSPDPFAAGYSGGAIILTTSYSFAELSGGVALTNTTSGKMFISLGTPMSVPVTNVAGNLSAPSATNPSDPDYFTRWGPVEITFNGNLADVANLTGLNLFSIPFILKTYQGSAPRNTFGYHVDGETMITKIVAAATNDSALIKDASGDFVRVLGPIAYAAGTIGPYRPLDDYLTYASANATPFTVADLYSSSGAGVRKATQEYQFSTIFTNINTTNYMYMTGGSETVGGVGMGHSIMMPYDDVAYQIYANNPDYILDGSTNANMADNDVYAAAVRDVLAGFAAGFIGSTVTDTVTGLQFKYEVSSNWFAAAQTLAFSDVQPTLPYYNAYGEIFWRYSDVYGFPFSDRLSSPVQAGLDPASVDILEVIVQPDVIPEPGVFTLAVVLVLIAQRRMKWW